MPSSTSPSVRDLDAVLAEIDAPLGLSPNTPLPVLSEPSVPVLSTEMLRDFLATGELLHGDELFAAGIVCTHIISADRPHRTYFSLAADERSHIVAAVLFGGRDLSSFDLVPFRTVTSTRGSCCALRPVTEERGMSLRRRRCAYVLVLRKSVS